MDKTYNPRDFEENIYNNWLAKNYFAANVNKNKKPFSLVMPPPNITGRLHIGHTLNNTIQDIITRFKRMQGFETLWLPGTDHAAIATEVEICKKLAQEGLTKEQIGREEFFKRVDKWFSDFGGEILHQLKQIGVSCDFNRLAFTLDDVRSRAVKQVFVDYYNKGLIYQGSRITNVCVDCKTAISDVENIPKAYEGKFWYVNYELTDKSGFVTIATTRPETIFGDVAIAVNPSDKRYKNLIGKTVNLPLTDRIIPIIGDDYVDIKFGTGALKITPYHDASDFDVALRAGLEGFAVIEKDGKLNDKCGEFAGLERFDARKKVADKLKKLGLLIKEEKHMSNVGTCERCGTIIEPLITKQWFVKMQDLARPAIEAVKSGELKYIPKRYEKHHLNWLENIKDWCVSRQIWLGHQLPIYYCDKCGEVVASVDAPHECPKCKNKTFTQETDVLDTWFSSALWPFSTMGWPEKTEELKYFYPTNVLVTAKDIIPFWVTKMVFSGIEFLKEIPFKEVVINGLVKDSNGIKMSKHLHNGIDPIDMINKYGADATRFSLVYGMSMGADLKYGEDKAKFASNFLNKLFNASKFVLMHLENFKPMDIAKSKLTLADKWILTELNKTIKQVTKHLEKYEQGIAIGLIYDFVWGKFCDWYIELAKTTIFNGTEDEMSASKNTLFYCLDAILKLLHPFIPFLTELVYQELPIHEETIMKAQFPIFNKKLVFEKESAVLENIMSGIKLIRNVRAEMQVPDNKKIEAKIFPLVDKESFEKNRIHIEKLAILSNCVFVNSEEFANHIVVNSPVVKVFIEKNQLIDIEKEEQRLNKEIEKTLKNIEYFKNRLENKNFIERAPKELVVKEKAQYAELIKVLEENELALKNLKK